MAKRDMVTFGIFLEKDVKDRLDTFAEERGLKKYWVVNEALRSYMGMPTKTKK